MCIFWSPIISWNTGTRCAVLSKLEKHDKALQVENWAFFLMFFLGRYLEDGTPLSK